MPSGPYIIWCLVAFPTLLPTSVFTLCSSRGLYFPLSMLSTLRLCPSHSCPFILLTEVDVPMTNIITLFT